AGRDAENAINASVVGGARRAKWLQRALAALLRKDVSHERDAGGRQWLAILIENRAGHDRAVRHLDNDRGELLALDELDRRSRASRTRRSVRRVHVAGL